MLAGVCKLYATKKNTSLNDHITIIHVKGQRKATSEHLLQDDVLLKIRPQLSMIQFQTNLER